MTFTINYVTCDNCGSVISKTHIDISGTEHTQSFRCTACDEECTISINVLPVSPGRSSDDLSIRASTVHTLKKYFGEEFYEWWITPISAAGGVSPSELSGTDLSDLVIKFLGVGKDSILSPIGKIMSERFIIK